MNDLVEIVIEEQVARHKGHAKQLLAETNLPLPVVAHRVGVSTVQYFTTLMRRETGNTPAKIRRHARTRFRRRIE